MVFLVRLLFGVTGLCWYNSPLVANGCEFCLVLCLWVLDILGAQQSVLGNKPSVQLNNWFCLIFNVPGYVYIGITVGQIPLVHTPAETWGFSVCTREEAGAGLLVMQLVTDALRGISVKQFLKELYRTLTGVKAHSHLFSREIRASSFYLCHAAVEMSRLLARGICTAALSSLLNLKLCCLLLPFSPCQTVDRKFMFVLTE